MVCEGDADELDGARGPLSVEMSVLEDGEDFNSGCHLVNARAQEGVLADARHFLLLVRESLHAV